MPRSLRPSRHTTLALCLGLATLAGAGEPPPRPFPAEDGWAAPSTLAQGTEGLIAGTTSRGAIEAGVACLREGGSAVDAALTVALAQVARAAGAWVSYAGILGAVVYEAKSGEVFALDAGFDRPRAEPDPATIPSAPTPSGRTALVPGFMAGVEALHQRFGSRPFAQLFQPAIEVAERGLVVDTVLGYCFGARREVLARLDATRATFEGPGRPYPTTGAVLRQPHLAATLRAVAAEGAAHMYRGAWAQQLVAAVQAEGGHLSLDDLASYRVRWEAPTQGTFGADQVHALGPTPLGGLHLVEGLQVLDALAPSPTTTAGPLTGPELRALGLTAQVGPLLTYLTPAQAAAFMPGVGLSRDRRLDRTQAGWIAQGLRARMQRPAVDARGHHSDAVVAVDAAGNAVALVHTINTETWGSTGLFVGGVSIPDAAHFQQAPLAAVPPGGRLPSPLEPYLVTREGAPRLVGASVGGGLHEATLAATYGVLRKGLDPQQAADMSRPLLALPPTPGAPLPDLAVIQGSIPGTTLAALRAAEASVIEVPALEARARLGNWVGIDLVPETGLRRGGAPSILSGDARAQ